MIHNNISFNHASHYGVSCDDQHVLVQLQDYSGEQVRVPLTLDEAQHMIGLLQLFVKTVKNRQTVDIDD